MGAQDSALPAGFGSLLGTNRGVPAYSNGHNGFVAGPAHRRPTGLAWQCVEYARRWWESELGLSFGDVATAAELWAPEARAIDSKSGSPVEILTFANGGNQAPSPGDLLIYRAVPESENLWAGHVAVVARVDAARVCVAEQNFSNQPWCAPTSHARELELANTNEVYRVCDPSGSILGWQRVASRELRGAPVRAATAS